MLEDSAESDFGRSLEYYKASGCKGVGEYMTPLPFDDPRNMNLFGQVEEAGLPLTFHIAPGIGGAYGCFDEVGLPRLEKVLKTFPDLRFLGHSQPFWAEISADVTQETRNGYPKGKVVPGRVVELMRNHPNLHGDLSAGSGYNAINRDPEFGCSFLEEFQDRLYFGTDIAHTRQETPIVEHLRRITEEGFLSNEAYEKITWRNATRLLGLKIERDAT
jgi:predicted TIM-barrel fold metal-dependent hydrolase